jgi:Protein of unknown function (DUF5818)
VLAVLASKSCVMEDAMKNRPGLIGAGAILVLALCCLSSAKNAAAQTRPHNFGVSTEAQQQTRQPSQEFQGTIEQAGTKYILEDKASGATYQLDNQDKAKQFLDQDVKVTGTLYPSTNTIEVSEIEEMK